MHVPQWELGCWFIVCQLSESVVAHPWTGRLKREFSVVTLHSYSTDIIQVVGSTLSGWNRSPSENHNRCTRQPFTPQLPFFPFNTRCILTQSFRNEPVKPWSANICNAPMTEPVHLWGEGDSSDVKKTLVKNSDMFSEFYKKPTLAAVLPVWFQIP